jgi:N-acetylneuraminate synthase
VTLGASTIEVHVVFSREMFGPDVPVSLTTRELRQLVDGTRFIERALRQPIDKDEMAGQLREMRLLFTKSVVARVDLPAGTVLREEHLAVKKPGTGIPAAHIGEIIGRRLARAVLADDLLRLEDFA